MDALAPAYPSRSDLDWCWYLRRQGAMGDAVERILHDIGVMHPGGWADWQPSTLTSTGAPVAMNFTQDQAELDLVMEVADPADDPTHRVNDVCKIMKRLGGGCPSGALRDVISAAQCEAQLRYGARLGIKQSKTQLKTMLFAELPPAAEDLSALMSSAKFNPVLEELGDQAQTTMLGYDGTTGQVTQYWVLQGADRSVLPKLAASAGVDADRLSAAIDRLTGTEPQQTMPSCKTGFSYTTTGDGTPPVLSLHFSAQRLFGNDTAIEQRVRACNVDRIPGYAQLMEILSPAPTGQTHHGLITMTAQQNDDPRLAISVAAAWHCPLELI